MKLREKYGWRVPGKTYSIADAVEADMDGSSYDTGRLEDLSATVDNTGRFLGKLTERLFDKGLLSKEDIAALLSGYEEAEE